MKFHLTNDGPDVLYVVLPNHGVVEIRADGDTRRIQFKPERSSPVALGMTVVPKQRFTLDARGNGPLPIDPIGTYHVPLSGRIGCG